VTAANVVPQLTAAADLVVAGRRVHGGQNEGLGLLRTTVSREGFRYLQLIAKMRLSLPLKLPIQVPMPASLEPIWLRDDLPVRLLTTRSKKFLVDSGVF
jgi:hypothetical protein